MFSRCPALSVPCSRSAPDCDRPHGRAQPPPIPPQSPPTPSMGRQFTGLGMRLERRGHGGVTTVEDIVPGFAAATSGRILVGDILE